MIYLILGTLFNIIVECYRFINYIKYFFSKNKNKYEVEENTIEMNKD